MAAAVRPDQGGTRRRRWSSRVTRDSDALDLPPQLFRQTSARRIAEGLKRSALASKRRKASPFQSAMSMLNFYINRAGRNLSKRQLSVLERAKAELRRTFDRPAVKRPPR